MKNELLPCPFCGSEDVGPSQSYDNENKPSCTYVECTKCAAMGPSMDLDESDEDDGIAAWNKRATIEEAKNEETITCQCGCEVPLKFAQSDSEGVDLCPACYIGLLGELIPKWIPVSERLPDTTRHVDVIYEKPRTITSAKFFEECDSWEESETGNDMAVTHWREQTTPPEKEQSK